MVEHEWDHQSVGIRGSGRHSAASWSNSSRSRLLVPSDHWCSRSLTTHACTHLAFWLPQTLTLYTCIVINEWFFSLAPTMLSHFFCILEVTKLHSLALWCEDSLSGFQSHAGNSLTLNVKVNSTTHLHIYLRAGIRFFCETSSVSVQHSQTGLLCYFSQRLQQNLPRCVF